MLCRCPDQIHPVVFGDSAVYQFLRSHLWVRKKGRNLYKKPFAFQSENWYVFFACFGCETTCAQHLFCCRAVGKEPARFRLRHQTCSCVGKPCENIPLQPLVPLATVAVEVFTRRLKQRSSTVATVSTVVTRLQEREVLHFCFLKRIRTDVVKTMLASAVAVLLAFVCDAVQIEQTAVKLLEPAGQFAR